MKVIPIYIEAGISGFKSPAAEYKDLISIPVSFSRSAKIKIISGKVLIEENSYFGQYALALPNKLYIALK